MRSRCVLSWLIFWMWAIPSVSASDALAVTLEVSGARAKKVATNAASPDRRRASERSIFHAEVNESLTLHWVLEAKFDPSVPDVLVHFYVAHVDGPNQLPDLTKPENLVLEGALTMDFEQKNSAQSSLTFRVSKPGRYLVRVEAQHEDLSPLEPPFAAMDLEVR